MNACLFCRCVGPFTTREHIVPASLGNGTDVLEGVVCDRCQNYLSREVEKPALEKTPFAFWRAFLGIKTKRGKLPHVSLQLPSKMGLFPAEHPLTDNVGFTAHEDGSTSIEVFQDLTIRRILAGADSLRLVLTPYRLCIMGRFLGKIALEFLAKADYKLAMSPEFDSIRSFIRRGSVKSLWPIYAGASGEITDLHSVQQVSSEFDAEVECYSYSLGITVSNEVVFAFKAGTDLSLICLSHSRANDNFSRLVVGECLACLHYPDGTW